MQNNHPEKELTDSSDWKQIQIQQQGRSLTVKSPAELSGEEASKEARRFIIGVDQSTYVQYAGGKKEEKKKTARPKHKRLRRGVGDSGGGERCDDARADKKEARILHHISRSP